MVLHISIHALRVEGDRSPIPCFQGQQKRFLSTPSGWRATSAIPVQTIDVDEFLSTPSGWRATLESIHKLTDTVKFLSTPSGWRATSASTSLSPTSPYFYPRPPGGGRRIDYGVREYPDMVFLSTPSGWRATLLSLFSKAVDQFLSTPSGWRATIPVKALQQRRRISIHALRVEGDGFGKLDVKRLGISIHALRVEGDLCRSTTCCTSKRFLSTPSGWRATVP